MDGTTSKVCDICEGFICGRPLKNLYNKKNELVLVVCDYCYRGLYGFRYSEKLLRIAADFMSWHADDSDFMKRRPENDSYKIRGRRLIKT